MYAGMYYVDTTLFWMGQEMSRVLWVGETDRLLEDRTAEAGYNHLRTRDLHIITKFRCIKTVVDTGVCYLYADSKLPQMYPPGVLAELVMRYGHFPLRYCNIDTGQTTKYGALVDFINSFLEPKTTSVRSMLRRTPMKLETIYDRRAPAVVCKMSAVLDAWQESPDLSSKAVIHALMARGQLGRAYVVDRVGHDVVFRWIGGGSKVLGNDERQKLKGHSVRRHPAPQVGQWMHNEFIKVFDAHEPQLADCAAVMNIGGSPKRMDWYRLCLPLKTQRNTPSMLTLILSKSSVAA